MLWLKRDNEGEFPKFRDEIEEMADKKCLDDLNLFERITGEDWEKVLANYITDNQNPLWEGMYFDSFYKEVVLRKIEEHKK